MYTSQTQGILALLKSGPVTSLDALEQINCFRLAARIKDLRNAGHSIDTERVTKNGKTFARYWLMKSA